MREYSNLLAGAEMRRESKRLENADLVMMQIRAKSGKKKISLDDILGKKEKAQSMKNRRVVSLDEKRSELSFLEEELGGSEYISS